MAKTFNGGFLRLVALENARSSPRGGDVGYRMDLVPPVFHVGDICAGHLDALTDHVGLEDVLMKPVACSLFQGIALRHRVLADGLQHQIAVLARHVSVVQHVAKFIVEL